MSNIVCSNADPRLGSILSGIPDHPIEDIQLNDIYIQHQGGVSGEAATIQPPELEAHYPEPNMFGPMPSQGFFIRHARNVELNNVEISSLKEDARPVFVLKDVKGIDFFRVRAPGMKNAPYFILNDVEDFSVGRSKFTPDTHIDRAEHQKL